MIVYLDDFCASILARFHKDNHVSSQRIDLTSKELGRRRWPSSF